MIDRKLRFLPISSLILTALILTACGGGGGNTILVEGTPQAVLIQTSDQVTVVVGQTQDKVNADNQAAGTAQVMRADAQAVVNSANATIKAAQIQDQNNANAAAANIAATSKIERANALATLNSAGSTQSAALTLDAMRQTQVAGMATTDSIAASTQTAVSNNIATQTQAAVISQGYADQARANTEQSQGPLGFVWRWGLPIFIVLLAALVLWGFWRWLRIQQANQRIIAKPAEKLQPPAAGDLQHPQDDSMLYLEGDAADRRTHLTKPDDQVGDWRDDVKRKLLSGEEDDEDGA